jgi:DNA mismatch endonuclease (patch repair protein)
MDNLSKSERSERMSRIKGKDTGPEMTVRRIVHGMGFRYHLHARNLPGIPDLVFPRLRKIIFVHGCFWHQHPGCGRQPKSKLEFWLKKLSQNRERDLRNQQELHSLGWIILMVLEPFVDEVLRAVQPQNCRPERRMARPLRQPQSKDLRLLSSFFEVAETSLIGERSSASCTSHSRQLPVRGQFLYEQ